MGELAIHVDAVLGDSLKGLRQGRAEPAAQSAARSCYSGSSGPCVWFGSISCHRLPLAVSIPVPSFTHPPVRRGSRDVKGARVSRVAAAAGEQAAAAGMCMLCCGSAGPSRAQGGLL